MFSARPAGWWLGVSHRQGRHLGPSALFSMNIGAKRGYLWAVCGDVRGRPEGAAPVSRQGCRTVEMHGCRGPAWPMAGSGRVNRWGGAFNSWRGACNSWERPFNSWRGGSNSWKVCERVLGLGRVLQRVSCAFANGGRK